MAEAIQRPARHSSQDEGGYRARFSAGGFTLVELLLTVGLLLLLLGAVIFSFSTLQRGAMLEEGAAQTEALIRFARAHAAGTGRQVQIRFEEMLDPDLPGSSHQLQVQWEPDPIARPGFFEPLPEASGYVQGLLNLVRIESVHAGFPESPTAATGGPTPSDSSERTEQSEETSGSQEAPARNENLTEPGVTSIRFYPDGSSDSIQLILASLDEEETRRIELQVLGDTATMRRRFLLPEETAETASEQTSSNRAGQTGSPDQARPLATK